MSAPHVHDWAFDWENPPGYYCAVVDCNDVTGACASCEGPTHQRFCSDLCASEFDGDARTKGEGRDDE